MEILEKETSAEQQEQEEEEDRGPGEWFIGWSEARYARLAKRGWVEKLTQVEVRPGEGDAKGERELPMSLFIPGPGREALRKLSSTYWSDTRRRWSERLMTARRLEHGRSAPSRGSFPPSPGVPGANNWIPIGPNVVRKGQATGTPPISGRTCGIAIAPGGSRAYVATADGGVWRSDDKGASWTSTMDGFDVDPTAFATTSNACGAVAIDPSDADRVYVGTGEADTWSLFSSRLTNALPSYHGVGPIRSDDGGVSWHQEAVASGSPDLAGDAFFALAVDPADRDNVVGATTNGLYRREPDGLGGYHWTQKRTGVHSSVVVCQAGGVTTFYSASFGGSVFQSADGNTWTAVGIGFPVGIGRVTLAVRPTDPSVLYAFVASGSSFNGLYRLDGGAGAWKAASGLPALGGQADYNLPMAVDPNDPNLVYLAGSAFAGDGSIYRCAVAPSGSAYSLTTTFVGSGVHADVHVLRHAPGDSNTLWTGCDGGVFCTTTATTTASFTHRNTGLSTLCTNFFSQHPTQLAVIFAGLQDNGTAKYTGEECWARVNGGDGGYTLINWADPTKVLVYANGAVYAATDGGHDLGSFAGVLGPPWRIMAEPLAGTPYNPGSPADANTVAFGAGTSLYVSTSFGVSGSWTSIATLTQNIFAMAFASPTRLFVGTTLGQIYRYDKSGAAWTQTRIDNAAAGPLLLAGLVTDILVDPSDASGASIYITFGGSGDQRHVWHFDGTSWANRSGTGAGALLDVEHNTIAIDPSTSTLYVGCDVGVWQSTDGGMTWTTLQNGLPDAAVLDLQLHPTSRLLRASLHGRGMFELKLDAPAQADVELYVRDTALDVGRASTVDGLADPETWPSTPVYHYLSRNIRVDVPTPAGYQTATSDIDFLVFNDKIVDGSTHVGTLDPMTGTVVNRVYVEVHNRGIVQAANVRVMLLVTTPSVSFASLPVGYEANVQAGTPISSASWATVGLQTLANVRSGFPGVAHFNLPSTMLPPPADLPAHQHHCLLALLHSPDDVFTSTQTNVDLLTIADHKVAQRNMQVVPFVGTPPPGAGTWAHVDWFGSGEADHASELVIDARRFDGRIGILFPPELHRFEAKTLTAVKKPDLVRRWAEKHLGRLESFIAAGRFNSPLCRRMMSDIRNAVFDGRFLVSEGREARTHILTGFQLSASKRYPLFLYIEPREHKVDTLQQFDLIHRDARTKRVKGGSTYRVNFAGNRTAPA
jgi:hypothetical protein